MANPQLRDQILNYLRAQAAQGEPLRSAEDIRAQSFASRATVNRYLARLVTEGQIERSGNGPSTRYAIAADKLPNPPLLQAEPAQTPEQPPHRFHFSPAAEPLIRALQAPIGTRTPVSYQRSFVDNYVPNHSSLLPAALAADLFAKGRANGQQPAGTYARKVLEQLLIDLAWHSSRLEGNRKSLLDTQVLFARGRTPGDDMDSMMLLNHKDAIEFMVNEVPEYGIRTDVVRNIQALLMQGLLADPDAIGAIRRTVVNITDSVYIPAQAPHLLEEMLGVIVEKVRQIKNPVEAAFFLWVNIAYLQPFEDGNKRTSRLCANLSLLLQNCAPLSFLDVQAPDYALAVLGVYEQQNVSLAVELFEWTYLRSMQKYEVILQAMGLPDPFRVKYREQLGEAIREVVSAHMAVETVLENLQVPAHDHDNVAQLLHEELRNLQPYNCARYRLSIRLTEEWIRQGRPGLGGAE